MSKKDFFLDQMSLLYNLIFFIADIHAFPVLMLISLSFELPPKTTKIFFLVIFFSFSPIIFNSKSNFTSCFSKTFSLTNSISLSISSDDAPPHLQKNCNVFLIYLPFQKMPSHNLNF